MSDSKPTTYKTRSIFVKGERGQQQEIKDIVSILKDQRLNFQTIVEKLEEKSSATVQDVTEPKIETDEGNLGIRIRRHKIRATYVLDEWHNDAHETVECEMCGKKVLRFAYNQHKNSRPCKARKNEKEVEQRNLTTVSVPTRRKLIEEELGGDVEHLKTHYFEGTANIRSTLKGKYYAKKELVEQSKKIYIPRISEKTDTKHYVMGQTERYVLTRDEGGERHVWNKTEYADNNRKVLYEKRDKLYNRDGFWFAEQSRKTVSSFTRTYVQNSLSTSEKLYA